MKNHLHHRDMAASKLKLVLQSTVYIGGTLLEGFKV